MSRYYMFIIQMSCIKYVEMFCYFMKVNMPEWRKVTRKSYAYV
jgi:hypothetical protein